MAEIIADNNGNRLTYDKNTGKTTSTKTAGQITGTAVLSNTGNGSAARTTSSGSTSGGGGSSFTTSTSNAAIKKLQEATDKATTQDKALAKKIYYDKADADTGDDGGGGGGGGGGSYNDSYDSGSYVSSGSSGSSSGGSKTSSGTTSTTTLNSLVDSLYGAQDTAYQGMADSANASLKAAYDYNLQKQAAERDEALREAYIQGEMSKRNIAEQLSRQGITGGAAESTLARLISNYQGARNEARGDYASGVQEMGNNYMTNANQNTNYYKQQAQTRKNTIYDTLLNYLLENYGKTTQTGSTKSYTYDENGNVTGITETPQYSVDTDTAKKLAAIIGSLSA